jgi:hypothetical protein
LNRFDDVDADPRIKRESPGWARGVNRGVSVVEAPEAAWPGTEPPPPKGTGRKKNVARAVKVYRPGEPPRWMHLGNDVETTRQVLAEETTGCGFSMDELLEPLPRGRLSQGDKRRRDALARGFARARERGATYEALAQLHGCSKSTARKLALDGAKSNF